MLYNRGMTFNIAGEGEKPRNFKFLIVSEELHCSLIYVKKELKNQDINQLTQI